MKMFGLGCSDGGCRLVDNSKGMHTNGGCKCLRYPDDIEKVKKLIAVAYAAQIVVKNYNALDPDHAPTLGVLQMENSLNELMGKK